MKVAKFGGSSLADAFQIKKVCDIILADDDRHVVVVSAPGKRNKEDTKVTDLLIATAKARISGNDYENELKAVINRFDSIATDLKIKDVIPEIEKTLRDVASRDFEDEVLYLDSVKAMGEDCSARVVARYLTSIGHDAIYCNPKEKGLILEHDALGKAVIQDESYVNLSTLANEKALCIFPGFYGYNRKGEIITFSRGGSDIISNCNTDLAPCLIAVPTQSFPVSPPPMTNTFLPFALGYCPSLNSLFNNDLVT